MFVFDDDEGLGVPILEPFLYLLFFGIDLKKNAPILEPFFLQKACPFWSLFFA